MIQFLEQNHEGSGVNKKNLAMMWDYEKGNDPLAPKGFLSFEQFTLSFPIHTLVEFQLF